MQNKLPHNKAKLAAAVLIAGATLSTAATAMPTMVDNGNDSGTGSLREALESGANTIVIATTDTIMITSPLVYSGDKPLSISGSGQTIEATMDFTLLEITSGANTSIQGLTFQGPGNFSIENQTNSDTPGKGIFLDVSDDSSGWVSLKLTDVTVAGVANHGIHVSDCDLADDCGGGSGGNGEGSKASILVELNNVIVSDVGNGKFDADGLRVDERGDGHIVFNARNSQFINVGADGVELDEGQNGMVKADVSGSVFNDNGRYCDPSLLKPALASFLDGADDEAEYDEDEQISTNDIPGAPSGTLDDSCFEYAVDYYDSGYVEAYEIAIDLDDGFDIDEADNGNVNATLRDSEIRRNYDEGIDFDEEGNGGINITVLNTAASDNTDDGFKLSEEDNGSIQAIFHQVTSTDNGGKGIVLEEADNGGLNAFIIDTSTSNNDDSDDTGLEVVQEDNGGGTVTVRDSDIADGIDAEGVNLIEE